MKTSIYAGCIVTMLLLGCDDTLSSSPAPKTEPKTDNSSTSQPDPIKPDQQSSIIPNNPSDPSDNGGQSNENGDGSQNNENGNGSQNGENDDSGQNGENSDGGQNGENGDGGQNGEENNNQQDLPYDVVGGIASGLEGLPCEEGERYCDDTNYAECQNNRFIVIEQCANNPETPLCIDEYGCRLCYPGLSYCKDNGNDIYACSDDGKSASFVKSCVSDPCSGGSCDNGCPEDARFIYLVDSAYTRFELQYNRLHALFNGSRSRG